MRDLKDLFHVAHQSANTASIAKSAGGKRSIFCLGNGKTCRSTGGHEVFKNRFGTPCMDRTFRPKDARKGLSAYLLKPFDIPPFSRFYLIISPDPTS